MPRGIPKSGKRAPRKTTTRVRRTKKELATAEFHADTGETEAQIDTRISERFDVLEYLTKECTAGNVRAMIVSGPPGLGKSYTVDTALEEWDPDQIRHRVVKGYLKAPALYKLLYAHRFEGNVIVFDDADTIFFDDTSLNLLKAACDTNDVRRISYMTEGVLIDEDSGERMPSNFEFNGTIIFITNYDFDREIERGSKLAPHLSALVSRAHYIDLALKTKKDYLVRIKQVVAQGLLSKKGLTSEEQDDTLKFVFEHADVLRELSLRIVLKVAAIRKGSKAKWKNVAKITCTKI